MSHLTITATVLATDEGVATGVEITLAAPGSRFSPMFQDFTLRAIAEETLTTWTTRPGEYVQGQVHQEDDSIVLVDLLLAAE